MWSRRNPMMEDSNSLLSLSKTKLKLRMEPPAIPTRKARLRVPLDGFQDLEPLDSKTIWEEDKEDK